METSGRGTAGEREKTRSQIPETCCRAFPSGLITLAARPPKGLTVCLVPFLKRPCANTTCKTQRSEQQTIPRRGIDYEDLIRRLWPSLLTEYLRPVGCISGLPQCQCRNWFIWRPYLLVRTRTKGERQGVEVLRSLPEETLNTFFALFDNCIQLYRLNKPAP